MDSHRQVISLIEGKMGIKCQLAYTDIRGLTVEFLTDEIAVDSIDDGTARRIWVRTR